MIKYRHWRNNIDVRHNTILYNRRLSQCLFYGSRKNESALSGLKEYSLLIYILRREEKIHIEYIICRDNRFNNSWNMLRNMPHSFNRWQMLHR